MVRLIAHRKHGRLALLVTLTAIIGSVSLLYGQTFFSEDFSDGTQPYGWQNIANDHSLVWEFDNPGARSINGSFDDNFAIIDPDHYGYPNTDASLITPLIQLDFTERLFLVFDHQYKHWSNSRGYVEISADGMNWDIIDELSADVGDNNQSQRSEYEITDLVGENEFVFLRWRFVGIAHWWAIDNIELIAVSSVPLPVSLINPSDQSLLNQLDTVLEWQADPLGPEPSGYDVYFDTVNPPLQLANEGTDSFFAPQLDYNTTYYWRVIPHNEQGYTDSELCPVWSFTTNRSTPLPPIMLSPVNGAEHILPDSELSWQAQQLGEPPIGYRVYLDTVSPPLIEVYEGSNTHYQFSLDFWTTYYWRVVPYNDYGETPTEECPIWVFTTTKSEPLPANLLFPADEATNIPVYGKLSWEASSIGMPTDGYYLYLDDYTPPTTLYYVDEQTEFEPTFEFNRTYYWRIVPYNSYGMADIQDCQIRSFTTADRVSLPLKESFQQPSLPVHWQNSDNLGNGFVWRFDNPGNRNISGEFGENFAVADRATLNNAVDASLITPAIDCREAERVFLSFEHQYRHTNNALPGVFVSLDGINWETIFQYGSHAGYPNPPVVNEYEISSLAAGQPTVYVKWRYRTNSPNGWWWAIDNIQIFDGTAPLPAQLVSPANEAIHQPLSTILSWLPSTAGSEATGYRVYLDSGFPPQNLVYEGEETEYSPSLELGTYYYWRVIPFNDDRVTPYDDCPIWSFRTNNPEPLPASSIYPSNGQEFVPVEISVEWSPSGLGEPATGYHVYFDTVNPPGYLLYEGEESSFEVSLSAGMTYYWRVVPYNDSGSTPLESCPVWRFTSLDAPFSAGIYRIHPIPGLGDFTSLNQTIAALINRGLAGNGDVVFEIAAGTYETQATISEIDGVSEESQVHFIAGDYPSLPVLTNSSASYTNQHLIRLSGAKYINFDNLIFRASDETSYHWSLHLLNQSRNISITNCYFQDPSNNSHHIVASNSSTSTSSTGINVENLKIANNTFNGGHNAVSIYGDEEYYLTGIEIKNNKFVGLSRSGSVLSYLDSFQFSSNTIEMNPSGDTMSRGIYLGYTRGAFQIIGNKIIQARAYGIVWGHHSLFFTEGGHINDGEQAIIANNMIGGGFTYSSNWTAGLLIHPQIDNIGIYFNSFNMDQPHSTNTQSCIFIRPSSPTNLDIRNNSFAYTGGGGGYAFYIASPASLSHFDHNNYYNNGSRFVWYGTMVPHMTSLRAVDGRNQHSRSGNPQYNSALDLHSYGAQLYAGGTPIEGLEYDIDLDQRDPISPNIGADEYQPVIDNDLAATTINGPVLIGLNREAEYRVTVENTGLYHQEEFTLKLMTRDGVELARNDFYLTIHPGESYELPLSWTPTTEGIYYLFGRVSLNFDQNPFNDDTLHLGVFVASLQAPEITIAVNNELNQVTLEWEPVPGANSYLIYSSQYPSYEDWGEPIAVIGNTSFTTQLIEREFFQVVASINRPTPYINRFNEHINQDRRSNLINYGDD